MGCRKVGHCIVIHRFYIINSEASFFLTYHNGTDGEVQSYKIMLASYIYKFSYFTR